jgi:hypothetical protein
MKHSPRSLELRTLRDAVKEARQLSFSFAVSKGLNERRFGGAQMDADSVPAARAAVSSLSYIHACRARARNAATFALLPQDCGLHQRLR